MIKYPKSIPKTDNKVSIWRRKDLQVNSQLQEMYKNQAVYDENNNKIKYNSGIGLAEGWYLYKVVKDNKLEDILEIGMAFGTSALYITEALKSNKKGKLISIDPFQSTQWKSIGILNIQRAKLNDYHELIEDFSYISLPHLLTAAKTYDLIFIDGMHLFDYTLLDIFYSVKLLRMNGVLCIDDIKHKGVQKVIQYIVKNYPFLQYIKNTAASNTMATFIKLDDDKREWNFHIEF